MGLEEDIIDIRDGISAGRFSNEASITQGVVIRLLDALSWPKYNTQIVCPEYSLGGRRVDYALCHPAGKPIAFIEVKQIGQAEKAERQLFEYAFHAGVPLAILTDGKEWNFFLPAEQGDYSERRVYKLNILERDITECVSRLNRYLKYDAIISGAAIEAAREDYRNVSRNRQINGTLPKAWTKLVNGEDELLVELVGDKVESLCGFRPDNKIVVSFLKENLIMKLSEHEVLLPSKLIINKVIAAPSVINNHKIGFTFKGQHFPARNGRGILISVIEELSKNSPEFFQKFSEIPKKGSRRCYIARTPYELFPNRPDLVENHCKKLNSGWWIDVNLSRTSMEKVIKMACEVANLRYEIDLVVNFG